jgi:hypothetical protein
MSHVLALCVAASAVDPVGGHDSPERAKRLVRTDRTVVSVITVAHTITGLRRDALAVSVLHDLDLTPTGNGILLGGLPPVELSWAECERALDNARFDTDIARHRLATWLFVRRRLADLVPAAADEAVDLAECGLLEWVRPLAFPVGHPCHPGPRWVADRVMGDAVDVGLGLRGLDPERPDAVLPVSPDLLAVAGLADTGCWSAAAGYLDAMGAIAAERWRRSPQHPLRPVGDCDVVTLLASRALRSTLAAAQGGMCACVVPMRTRGWTELRRVDPAFAVAAVGATDDEQRGFHRPLLVTVDEIALAAVGGRPEEIALRDAEADTPWRVRTPYR